MNLSGYFRRRPVDDADAEIDRAVADAWALVGDDTHPDDEQPIERTDLIPVTRRQPEPPVEPPQDLAKAYARASRTVDVQRNTIDILRSQYEAADEIAKRNAELLEEYQRAQVAAMERADQAEIDWHEAEKAVDQLRRALDDIRPAPGALALAERLAQVWWTARSESEVKVTGPLSSLEQRWRAVAEAAIDTIRGLWPIEHWPLTPAEQNEPVGALLPAEIEQNHPAGGWPYKTSPGGGAEAESPPVSAVPSAPGDPETSPGGGQSAEQQQAPAQHPKEGTTGQPAPGDTHREQLARTLARRDLVLTDASWDDLYHEFRDHYRGLASDVVASGWRPPPVDRAAQRPVVAQLLTDHEQLEDGTCRCGFGCVDRGDCGELMCHDHPLWHAEHVAEQLLATGAIAR